MANFNAVTDDDLERAGKDPAFRRKLLSENLAVLLVKLNKLRSSSRTLDKAFVCEIRDGADMAVKLADLLEATKGQNNPSTAA
jgi:hypothetical protein